MQTRKARFSYALGQDTPEIDIVMKAVKFRDLRKQLEALDKEPRGTPLRIDVELSDGIAGSADGNAAESAAAEVLAEEVKAIQNAVYSWARAKQLQKQGLAVSAVKKLLTETTAVVRVTIDTQEEASTEEAQAA